MKYGIKKIIIRTPNWLGDSVMSIPAVIGVKKLFPDAEISIWTKQGLSDLWQFIPETAGTLDSAPKGHAFDLGILLTNSFRSALQMYLAKIPERRGYNVNFRRFLLTQPVPIKKKCKEMHQINYFLGILEGLGNFETDKLPGINIPETLKSGAKDFLIKNGWSGKNKLIGIHATAKYGSAKCWPKERFSKLIDKLIEIYDAQIVIAGSPDEKEDIENILNNAKSGNKVISVAGKSDLKQLMGIISLSDMFIANDSGPMHIASAVGTPLAAIFGSTDPMHTGPRNSKTIILQKQTSCSPCFKRVCPENLECMNSIEVDDVLKAVKRLANV